MRNPLASPWQQKWFAMEVTHPKVQEMASALQALGFRWFRNAAHDGPSTVVLRGESGCGKTHCAKRLLRWCQSVAVTACSQGHYPTRAPSAMYAEWGGVVDGFKEGCYEIMDDLCGVDMLVLDDLGSEHDPSRNALSKLCHVLTRREGLWTVITTNIKATDWGRRWDMRVADRLLRHSKVIDLAGTPTYSAWSPQDTLTP